MHSIVHSFSGLKNVNKSIEKYKLSIMKWGDQRFRFGD